MKRTTLGILFLFIATLSFAQSTLSKRDIIGRWVETERIMEHEVNEILTPSILIFKEDDNFHKGEDKEGVILFAIAGRYDIVADSINMKYWDFTGKNGGDSKRQRKMSFKVLEIKNKTMKAAIQEGRLRRYTATFRKQE